MSTTSRIILACVLVALGADTKRPGAALAASDLTTAMVRASAAASQASTARTKQDDADRTADLLSRARQAMDDDHLDVAEKLIAEAEGLDAHYGLLHLGDTPKRARRDLEKKQSAADKPSKRFSLPFPLGRDDAEQVDPFAARGAEAPSATSEPGALGPSDARAMAPPMNAGGASAAAWPAESTQYQSTQYESNPASDGRFESSAPPAAERSASSAGLADGRRAQSDGLLLAARRALAVGDAAHARDRVNQARALAVEYEFHEDAPDKVAALIDKHQTLSTSEAARRESEGERRRYALNLMEQAEGLLAWRDVDEAERLATLAAQQSVTYGPFEQEPSKLLERVRAARLAGGNARASQATASAGAGQTSPRPLIASDSTALPVNDQVLKQQARALLQQARASLASGDLDRAERLGRQAETLGVPEAAFAPGEDRPGMVLWDLQKARLAQGVPAPYPSGAGAPEAYPTTQANYRADQDATRNIPAQASAPLPNTARDEPGRFTADNIFPPGEDEGARLLAEGEQALRDRNVPRALDLFRRAAGYRDEFDPATWQRLQDHLQLLSVPPTGTERPGAASPLVDETSAQQQLLARQISAQLAGLENESRKLREADDSKRAAALLDDAQRLVESSGLEPAYREQLLRRIGRDRAELQQFIEQNRGRLELAERNTVVKDQIEREQRTRVEVQERLALLVDDFNRLMDERRFAEAEVLAKRAQEFAPDEPVVAQLKNQVRQTRRILNELELRDLRDLGTEGVLASVDRSAIPFDDRNAIVFPEAKEWADLTTRRRQMQDENGSRRSERELEIERLLKTPVSVSYQDRALADVMDDLAALAQINVRLDPQGLAEEGVTSDTPVTLNLRKEISLKSALNLILEPLNLRYVIKDEVLKITSEYLRDNYVIPVTYDVADLVIPIPNFVPSSRIGLGGALQDAHATLGGFGASSPLGTASPLAVVASKSGAGATGMIDPSVLANAGAPASMYGGGGRGQPIGYGPGGVGGGVEPDFDSLIELITSTIAPQTWDEMGGPGAIAPFEGNLTLVITQTQDVHDQIADLLDQLRRLQDLQVTIEVRFITLNDNFFERIGIDFDFDIDDDTDSPLQLFGRQLDLVAPGGGPLDTDDDYDDVLDTPGEPPRNFRDQDHGPSATVGLDSLGNFTSDLDIPFRQGHFPLSVPQFGGFMPGAGATIGLAIMSDIEAMFLLEAAQGDRRSNILQAPKVTLFNGQQAFVADQSQSPFVISVIPVVGDFAAAQQPVIVVLNQGTQLSVQAVISSDRRFVRLTVVPFFSQIGDVDTFTFTGSTTTTDDSSSDGPDDATTGRQRNQTVTREGTTVQLPTISFTTVTTTVSVPDGGTVLLGGIKRLSEGRNEFGVPLLNKIPYINRLFRNVGIGRETQSLMMMVTPRIIIQEEEEALLGVPPTP